MSSFLASYFRRLLYTGKGWSFDCFYNSQQLFSFFIHDKLRAVGGDHYFKTEIIIQKSHEIGAYELINRSIKEFATKEQLPFKSFGMNRSYYFLLVITHFIFEAYKRDITHDIIPISVYPNTFRRKLIDFAAKLTSHARNIKLCVTKTIFETINMMDVWFK